MQSLSDVIEIKSVGNQLMFSCEGDSGSQETVWGEKSDGINFIKNDSDISVKQGYYDLKNLGLFTKCSSLCNNITLCMKNDFPLIIIFMVGNLGVLKLALAPKIDVSN